MTIHLDRLDALLLVAVFAVPLLAIGTAAGFALAVRHPAWDPCAVCRQPRRAHYGCGRFEDVSSL